MSDEPQESEEEPSFDQIIEEMRTIASFWQRRLLELEQQRQENLALISKGTFGNFDKPIQPGD